MPIFSYFAVAGSALVALLFLADAKLEKNGPMPFNNEFTGMPKAWHPESARPVSNAAVLVSTPAPAPDMSSEAVKAAAPPPSPLIVEASAAPAAAAVPAKEAAPKPKRVAKRRRLPDNRQDFALSRNNDTGPFGGALFGRF
jgi:hypothetical protein